MIADFGLRIADFSLNCWLQSKPVCSQAIQTKELLAMQMLSNWS